MDTKDYFSKKNSSSAKERTTSNKSTNSCTSTMAALYSPTLGTIKSFRRDLPIKTICTSGSQVGHSCVTYIYIYFDRAGVHGPYLRYRYVTTEKQARLAFHTWTIRLKAVIMRPCCKIQFFVRFLYLYTRG
ncbi:unnamed protein product [Ixodes pacificus]